MKNEYENIYSSTLLDWKKYRNNIGFMKAIENHYYIQTNIYKIRYDKKRKSYEIKLGLQDYYSKLALEGRTFL